MPVLVDEPSVDDTIAILRGLKERYEVHHGVRIEDGALVAAARLADRHVTDRFMPDKAIDSARRRRRAAAHGDRLPAGGARHDRARDAAQLEIERRRCNRRGRPDASTERRLEQIERELGELREEASALREPLVEGEGADPSDPRRASPRRGPARRGRAEGAQGRLRASRRDPLRRAARCAEAHRERRRRSARRKPSGALLPEFAVDDVSSSRRWSRAGPGSRPTSCWRPSARSSGAHGRHPPPWSSARTPRCGDQPGRSRAPRGPDRRRRGPLGAFLIVRPDGRRQDGARARPSRSFSVRRRAQHGAHRHVASTWRETLGEPARSARPPATSATTRAAH
jgi:hypothetical protein